MVQPNDGLRIASRCGRLARGARPHEEERRHLCEEFFDQRIAIALDLLDLRVSVSLPAVDLVAIGPLADRRQAFLWHLLRGVCNVIY